MCAEIELGDKVMETVGELAALVGRENIVFDKRYISNRRTELFEEEFCLCPVDIPATASKAGYISKDPNLDCDDWHIGYRWERRGSDYE